ncbi:MAG TPA: VOC family protein [Cryptosporangiaceae bacterium]|nr:VOC family protein [Cryptosporangiaceae bacterium]
MRITMAGLLVDDQDRAGEFYTTVLGFQVKTDVAYGPGARWLSVVSPDEPDGTQLLLGLADDAGREYQKIQRERGKPAIAFTTDDCRRDYEALRANGVTFTVQPTTMSYGGTDAVLDDTCGNLICLHQD